MYCLIVVRRKVATKCKPLIRFIHNSKTGVSTVVAKQCIPPMAISVLSGDWVIPTTMAIDRQLHVWWPTAGYGRDVDSCLGDEGMLAWTCCGLFVRMFVRSSGQILLPRYLTNGVSSLDEITWDIQPLLMT